MKSLIITVILGLIPLLNGCIQLKAPHYNDLSEEEKKQSQIKTIDLDNHENQETGVYSITSQELKNLFEGNELNLVCFYKYYCGAYVLNLETLSEEADKGYFKLYNIGIDDIIEQFEYKKWVDVIPTLDKVYMLDNDTYGNIDDWHENGILANKHDTFVSELEPNFEIIIKEKFDLEEITPNYILFDDNGDILYALDYLDCETFTCESQTQEMIEKIKELAK